MARSDPAWRRGAGSMACMTSSQTAVPASRYPVHPREIAAAVTLRAAAAALVAPPTAPLTASGAVAVTTACGALATRIALVEFLADAQPPEPAALVPFDPFGPSTLPGLQGLGRMPDRDRLRTAGDRCVDAWRRWSSDVDTADDVRGVAGALALGAWCSWALGSTARALTRARYAIDLVPDDPLAGLVLRTASADRAPAWR